MKIFKKIKDKILSHKHKKQVNLMWKSKEKEKEEQNLFEIYSKNIMWVQLGKNSISPYYFVIEDEKRYIKLPYVELDVGSYIKNGNIIINKFMEVKN